MSKNLTGVTGPRIHKSRSFENDHFIKMMKTETGRQAVARAEVTKDNSPNVHGKTHGE